MSQPERKKKGRRPNPPSPRRSRRQTRWAAGLAIILLGSGVVVCSDAGKAWMARLSGRTTNRVNASVLVGRWQRPDGGYVIEILSVERGGSLTAGYFNPNPIRVERAEWNSDLGTLAVFIELRDRNYPGATYRLGYVAERDSLVGKYYQPLMEETFEVEFTRAR